MVRAQFSNVIRRLQAWCRQTLTHHLRLSAIRSILLFAVLLALLPVFTSCSNEPQSTRPSLSWYIFDEPSGAFVEAAEICSRQSEGSYTIELVPLPADADQQREQLVRRLAARDSAIDIIGMDVIWTAEFAAAGCSARCKRGQVCS